MTGTIYQPPTWADLVLERAFPDLEKKMNEIPKYTDFYNRYGMLSESSTRRLLALPDAQRHLIIDEHHRRSIAIATAWHERGEIIDRHDPIFDVEMTKGTTTNG